MSDGTPIEWTDATWPIVAGCEKESPGCKNCWAIRESWRLAHNPNRKIHEPYFGTVDKLSKGALVWSGIVRTIPRRLTWPLRWRKPRRIFVCSQSDLFHPKVPFGFIDQAFAVMGMCRRHTFQILTKHPDRMHEYLSDPNRAAAIGSEQFVLASANPRRHVDGYTGMQHTRLPFENVWLGFSAENQEYFDLRWSDMEPLALAGWLVWASLEPLLDPIDAKRALGLQILGGEVVPNHFPYLRWVVAGGESGPKARPSHPDWYRQLRDQCAAASVPFLFKQWGNWIHEAQMLPDGSNVVDRYVLDEDGCPGALHDWLRTPTEPASFSVRIPKKDAGRHLDGREHTEFPS